MERIKEEDSRGGPIELLSYLRKEGIDEYTLVFVKLLYLLRKEGFSQRAIARLFKMSQSSIHRDFKLFDSLLEAIRNKDVGLEKAHMIHNESFEK